MGWKLNSSVVDCAGQLLFPWADEMPPDFEEEEVEQLLEEHCPFEDEEPHGLYYWAYARGAI